MNSPAASPPVPRQHYLDAVRGFAMLLGIAYHAALSFTGNPWMTVDTQTSTLLDWFSDSVHGFRMQLFFLVSGYFTMLLYCNRGFWSLLRNRFLRVFVPLILGLFTILPLLAWSGEYASNLAKVKRSQGTQEKLPLIEAIRGQDHAEAARLLKEGANPKQLDPEFDNPPINWAALFGDVAMVRLLLDNGATVLDVTKDRYGPLHSAAFLGYPEVLKLLIERGANIQSLGKNRDTAADLTRIDLGSTQFVVGLMRLPPRSEDEIKDGREKCIALLDKKDGGEVASGVIPAVHQMVEQWRNTYREFVMDKRWSIAGEPNTPSLHLILVPLLGHLWFLWFLCWFALIFGLLAVLLHYLRLPAVPSAMVLSPFRLLWFIPLTMLPQVFMGVLGGGNFGPDTSLGIVLMPHMVFYYFLFFMVGALYYNCQDQEGELGRHWWCWFLVAAITLTVYRVGSESISWKNQVLPAGLLQVLYAWAMVFGMIGLFRYCFGSEKPWVRYLSDSAYWLYLVHLPLIIVLQAIVRTYEIPALIKFIGVTTVATVLLLISYQLLVRHTPIGWLLNGRRKRKLDPGSTPPADAVPNPSLVTSGQSSII